MRACVCSEDDDWWEAECVTSGHVGLIPRNYVTLDSNDKESQLYDIHVVTFTSHQIRFCYVVNHDE